jgi:hypothetical protein
LLKNFMMRYPGLLAVIICLSFLSVASTANAQLLAFPTAEGAGKYVTGGRGSIGSPPRIFEVTTLNDDASAAATPGTFRYACTNNSPSTPNRIIVFRVSGTIHLFAPLSLNRAFTTIAGQTAPGEGICIADYPVTIGVNNMIIRYLRFRLGDKNQNLGMVDGSGGGDAFGDNGGGRQNIIIDHCTASWSDDESFTIYKGDNVTVQWCMITEPLNYSYHFETGDADYEQHAYGGIWGGAHASFHHNLIAHIKGRGPRFDGTRNIASENVDFRNNVIYNWIDYNTNGGEGGNYNVVNNYYKYGPSTLTSSTSGVNRRSMILNPYKQTSPAIPYGKYYLTGNYTDNSADITMYNWKGAAFNSGSLNDSTNSKVTTPFAAIDIVMQTAQNAYTSVLANAGCFLPRRDTLDQRIINDVMNRTGGVVDVQGGYAHGTPYSTSQTAWPTLASGTAQTDTDHDGMPDVWETKRGLNPNSAADVNGYISTSGYSNIENYLNGDSIVATGVLNNCVTTKKFGTTASGSWRHALDTIHSYYLSSSYTAATDSMNVVASVLDNGAFGDFTVNYYTTNALRYDAYNHPYLNRNITIVPGNSGNITAPVTVRFYFTKTEYDALKAADNSITSLSDLRIIKVASNSCLTSMAGNTSVIVPSAGGSFGTYQNGYYLEFATSSFSTFFITSVSSAGTLPLQLTSFNGVYDGRKSFLTWKTANEINTDRFEVERSTDAVSFSLIGTVTAKGNISGSDYSLTDAKFIFSVAYYRLKVIDKDGKFTYSKIVRLTTDNKTALTVYPNPVRTTLVINHPLSDAVSFVEIYAANGTLIKRIKVGEAVMQTEVKIVGIAAGTYRLLYKTKSLAVTTTFIKGE